MRDRGNQVTLGIFLGTFAYALMVLRSVRTNAEGAFTPHLALTVAIVLALLCVATLVFFVGHMAQRINVDVVIQLVSEDVRSAIKRLTTTATQSDRPSEEFWRNGALVRDQRHGYLQHVDESALANWAANHDVSIKLLIEHGDYLFPGAPVAVVKPAVDGLEQMIRDCTALGPQRSSPYDLKYPIRQLVEVAVRALSPGINDPHTAISVLDRLGAALCEVAPLTLANGVITKDGILRLLMPKVDYSGLTDAMFHLIRQNAKGSATVLIRSLEVLSAVAEVERDSTRRHALQRHADLILGDAERSIHTPEDLRDVQNCHLLFIKLTQRNLGP